MSDFFMEKNGGSSEELSCISFSQQIEPD